MATWPSASKAPTTNLDSGTDSPAAARADIKTNVDNVNEIIDMFNIASPSNNQILKYNSSNSRFELAADAGGISDVVADTTPQLGGDLDVNGSKIVSASNGNIALEPNGTGKVTANKNIETTGDVKGFELWSTCSNGDEGGQINLGIPATNTSLTGQVTIDVYQNKLRFFQGNGAKGAYIDLTAAGDSVGTNLLGGGGGAPRVVIKFNQNVTEISGTDQRATPTEVYDPSNICTISSTYNITLAAGTYLVTVPPSAGSASGNSQSANYALFNVSGTTTRQDFISYYGTTGGFLHYLTRDYTTLTFASSATFYIGMPTSGSNGYAFYGVDTPAAIIFDKIA
jgi:hypothetical protein